jgi:hypothetical protein
LKGKKQLAKPVPYLTLNFSDRKFPSVRYTGGGSASLAGEGNLFVEK